MATSTTAKSDCTPAQEMLVRLLIVAEMLVSPEEAAADSQLAAEQRAKQEAVRAALEKPRADQDDV